MCYTHSPETPIFHFESHTFLKSGNMLVKQYKIRGNRNTRTNVKPTLVVWNPLEDSPTSNNNKRSTTKKYQHLRVMKDNAYDTDEELPKPVGDYDEDGCMLLLIARILFFKFILLTIHMSLSQL